MRWPEKEYSGEGLNLLFRADFYPRLRLLRDLRLWQEFIGGGLARANNWFGTCEWMWGFSTWQEMEGVVFFSCKASRHALSVEGKWRGNIRTGGGDWLGFESCVYHVRYFLFFSFLFGVFALIFIRPNPWSTWSKNKEADRVNCIELI